MKPDTLPTLKFLNVLIPINSCFSTFAQQHIPDWHLMQACCPENLASWPRDILAACIDERAERLQTRIIIIAGISMGARGVYELAYEYADRYTAMVCLAGIGIHTLCPRFEQLPIWIAHGQDDEIVPVELAKRMADQLPRSELRILESTGHDCASATFTDVAFWQWLKNTREMLARHR